MQIAPGLVSGVFALSLPLLPFIILFSAPAFSWWFRHIASPASGQGVVYGATIQGSQALSKQKFDDLRAESTARPDLSGGKAGDLSEDTQERFWKDSGFDPKAAKKAVEADAQWRSKFGINNILTVRCASCGSRCMHADDSVGIAARGLRLRVCHATCCAVAACGVRWNPAVSRAACGNATTAASMHTGRCNGAKCAGQGAQLLHHEEGFPAWHPLHQQGRLPRVCHEDGRAAGALHPCLVPCTAYSCTLIEIACSRTLHAHSQRHIKARLAAAHVARSVHLATAHAPRFSSTCNAAQQPRKLRR